MYPRLEVTVNVYQSHLDAVADQSAEAWTRDEKIKDRAAYRRGYRAACVGKVCCVPKTDRDRKTLWIEGWEAYHFGGTR